MSRIVLAIVRTAREYGTLCVELPGYATFSEPHARPAHPWGLVTVAPHLSGLTS
jgi:hypothetical protein